MDYLYENLGDERFQEFCSALINKDFPNIQAFPVGQPDGGRDTIIYTMNKPEKDFCVFQVKFVRNPHNIKDVHKWLTEILTAEAKKIKRLIPRGAKAFYLLTNVNGTAHLDAGSIDKVNKEFEAQIKIPSICWWRDDLSRKFESDPIFKWSFPEILNGQDILNSVLFSHLNESAEKRESVITAYLTDQYERDNEVKFKQIDLQNKLFSLFTDVPLRVKKVNEKNRRLNVAIQLIHNQNLFEFAHASHNESMGAAEFLLSPITQNNIERLLLEGGPGQGKSTISQYICQAHRVRLLNRIDDVKLLSDKVINSPVRLPFKLDLRDIALWVEGKNPYQETLSEEYFKSIWTKGLESFLVGHIYYHSQLDNFTSTDLIAVCKLSSILLVFDGFDEIASVQVRAEVIDFINKGINRISANSKSIQVLVTSRPAAFSDSVGFSVENYPHIELTDITPKIISSYVEKWVKASNLNHRDGNEIKKLVQEKLAMPHLKDLAKSPMQLAIFISLLRTKGQSLPNKRTALYDSYITLFFDRESEKNHLIRDQRDLIINIHQYLAWILHSEAEMFKNSGSMHIDDLKVRLKEYLAQDGHETHIADELFDVMKERVCALVSRVQGTFEFEVQPLREYFCAKHLYDTAPHSNAGNEKPGTKPDRFHAMLRNFYWQNVVRFFAGCVGKGELDMVIQQLKDFQKDELFQYTDYPRIITSQILSDYVFTQTPLKRNEVVSIILNGINAGSILNQSDSYSNNERISLPEGCGRDDVVRECFRKLKEFPNHDYASELIGILKNNAFRLEEEWSEYLNEINEDQKTKWLDYGLRLGILFRVDLAFLASSINSDNVDELKKRLEILARGNRFDVIDSITEYKKLMLRQILDGSNMMLDRHEGIKSLQFLSTIFNTYLSHQIINQWDRNISVKDFLNSFNRRRNESKNSIYQFTVADDTDKSIAAFKSSLGDILKYETGQFRFSLLPWDEIIENGRKTFGECHALIYMAIIAAGIKAKDEVYEEYDQLENHLLSLAKRIRCARMKSGNLKYWQSTISQAKNLEFVLLVFFTWATPKTIFGIQPQLTALLKKMPSADVDKLILGLQRCIRESHFEKAQRKYIYQRLESIKESDILRFVISIRFSYEKSDKFVYDFVKATPSNWSENVLRHKLDHLVRVFFQDQMNVAVLEEIKDITKSMQSYSSKYLYHQYMHTTVKMPYDIAKIIMENCTKYPIVLSTLAEKSCRYHANKLLVPVGEIAKEEKWFS